MNMEILFKKVTDIVFPTSQQNNTRIQNCFRNANIICVGDILSKTMQEYLEMNQMGKKCIAAINQYLSDYYLTIGMKLTNWPINRSESMTDQQQWDAAATEAGYLPVSDYVEQWKTARAVYDAAREANIQAMDALEQATIAYHDSVNRWLTRIGGNRP